VWFWELGEYTQVGWLGVGVLGRSVNKSV